MWENAEFANLKITIFIDKIETFRENILEHSLTI